MSGTNAAAAGQASANAPAALTQADIDKARAEGRSEGHAAGLTEGAEQGAKAERDRVTAIFAQAAGKTEMAVTCITSGLSVEQSSAILAAAPAKVDAVQGNAFAAAMAATGNPKVSGVEAGAAEPDEATLAASIVANFRGQRAAAH